MDSAVMKLICAHRGSMDFDDLIANAGFGISNFSSQNENFHVVELNGNKRVIASTKVRLCKDKNCQSCTNLHICKFYLYGDCKNSKRRWKCQFCHDLNTEHNAAVLRENNLEELDRTELCTLLLQNDTTLLPPVCFNYNKGSGEYGLCPEQMSCRRLHICDKYIRGTCSSGVDCPRSHDFFEPHPLKTLQDRGLYNELIASLLLIYQNLKYNSNRKTGQRQSQKQPVDRQTSTPYQDPENSAEICLYHIRGRCKYRDKCRCVHFNLPYKWEVKTSEGWSTLSDNEEVEKDYCNPSKTYSRSFEPVCFDTMTKGLSKVRRLSTLSSVLNHNFILTTEWAWYWEDEFGNWVQYASSDFGHHCSSISSDVLEQKYQNNSSEDVQFTVGSQTYKINFQGAFEFAGAEQTQKLVEYTRVEQDVLKDMIQTNRNYGTKKLVRRRPVFVSAADVKSIKTSKRAQTRQPNFKDMPEHWDKSMVPETGYTTVVLNQSMSEYREILALFSKTMQGFRIAKIERVQNKNLWEVFQWQKNLMKKNNGGKDGDKRLFHGTDSRHVDAICQQNFDWRICGTHGTAYGKGSYFARDAKYSHSYTSSSGKRTMFVCRVLVGEYTKGDSSYCRPPSKDGGDVSLFDSCVDNMNNPSIFVVFEKHQVYPEYIIQYYEDMVAPPHLPHYVYSVPTPSPTPRTTPQPTSSASYGSAYTGSSSSNANNSDSTSSCTIS